MRIAFALFLVAMLTPGLASARVSKSAAPLPAASLPAASHLQSGTNHANLASSPMSTAIASPLPAGPVTGESPTLSRLARAQIDIFRAGKIDRTQYGPELNAFFTDLTLTQWSQILAIIGSVVSFSYLGSTLVSGLPVSQYSVTFEHAIAVPGQAPTKQWIESIALDQPGRVVYLSFVPKH